MRKLSTGEPCAGEPPARFGGRGESGKGSSLPPIEAMDGKAYKYIHVFWMSAILADMTLSRQFRHILDAKLALIDFKPRHSGFLAGCAYQNSLMAKQRRL